MKCSIRLTSQLTNLAIDDLRRPHPFAYERVGFFRARAANAGSEGWILLPIEYWPVPDDQYIEDDTVGARIDGNAIRSQMQVALTHSVGILHVHLHDHQGIPGFSRTDRTGIPPVVRAFANARPDVPHAGLVLSRNSAAAIVLVPEHPSIQSAHKIVLVGTPTVFAAGSGEIYA